MTNMKSTKSTSSLPGPQKSGDILLLELSLELIYNITNFMTPAEKALLSQTCRALRVALKQANASTVSCDEYLTYLASRARGLPQRWACEHCMTFHPISELDTPESKRHASTCPREKHLNAAHGPRRYLGPYTPNASHLPVGVDHHHVQLALKYTRLQDPAYSAYLKALMKPYHQKIAIIQECNDLTVDFSAYPKIVKDKGDNLKYLMSSTWKFHKHHNTIHMRDLAFQAICPHFQVYSYDTPLIRDNDLEKLINQAFVGGSKGERLSGACSFCATDFTVRATQSHLYIHAWQDLGPEGSVTDARWTSHRPRLVLGTILDEFPPAYHKPGSIEELYGSRDPRSKRDTSDCSN